MNFNATICDMDNHIFNENERQNVKIASNILDQSCINQAIKVAGDAAAAYRSCTSQATKVAGSVAVVEARSTSQAMRVAGSAALAEEKSINQATKLHRSML